MSCTSSMSAVPPQYSIESRHTSQVPSYSLEPLLGERRLEHNPGVTRRRTPSGTYQKCNSHIAILLTEQEDGASSPTYSRNATIRGEVFMKDSDDIFAVTIKARMICCNFSPNLIIRRLRDTCILVTPKAEQCNKRYFREKLRCGKVFRQVRYVRKYCRLNLQSLQHIRMPVAHDHCLRPLTFLHQASQVSPRNVNTH